MSQYTTGDIARLCGVSVRTVQYYDTRGILAPTDLSEGGRRLYSEDNLAKMKVVCFLKELGLPLNSIAKLMREDNSAEVISLILEEHAFVMKEELLEKEAALDKIKELQQALKKTKNVSVEALGDIAHIMEHKKKLRKLRLIMILTAIPVGILEWGSILLWIFSGIWWPFVVYTAVAIPWGIWISFYYFKSVAYICPECHHIFVPKFKQAFWASHTPNTRKLTCPKCSYRGYCVDTHRSSIEQNEQNDA